jgi:hypothetical protein
MGIGRWMTFLGSGVLVLGLAACDLYDPVDTVTGRSLAALTPADGCDDVLGLLKSKTIADMEKAIDQQVDWMLKSEYGWCYGWMEDGFGQPVPGEGPTGGKGNDRARDYSTTNTQEVDVDEADFVKNDNKYIYVLTNGVPDDEGNSVGRLEMVEAWPAASMRKVGAVQVEGSPTAMFLDEDRIVAYSGLGPVSSGSTYEDWGPWAWGGGMQATPGGGLCTYGYDCEFIGDGQKLKITEYDLRADRTDADVTREIVFNGSYLNSRRIGNIVHTVVVFPEVTLPGVTYWPEELEEYRWWCGQEIPFTDNEIRGFFADLKARNRALIEATSIDAFLPSITDTRWIDGEPVVETGLLGDCNNFYLTQAGDGSSFLSLVSFDLTTLGEIGVTTVVGRPGAVYASTDALYIGERHNRSEMMGRGWYFEETEDIKEATTIHKFNLVSGEPLSLYAGSGAVKGRVLNQFSMDEHKNHLRVATSSGRVPDPRTHSTVSVLAEKEGELVVVGLVDNIAPDEDIRSARFDGDKGFIVTFKYIDPLFSLDLSDPTAPRIAGELKIPGFSTYMHLLDSDHLLSIGYDAEDHGSYALYTGLLLQVFDVSNLAEPALVHRQKIGSRSSSSDAATNHLAFNYFPSRKVLGVPVVVCEGGEPWEYGDTMTFSGLQVWRVTADEGFSLLGGIPHIAPMSGENAYSYCGSWWTQGNSLVKRSVFMDDWAYSIAPNQIRAASLADLGNPVATVDLGQ